MSVALDLERPEGLTAAAPAVDLVPPPVEAAVALQTSDRVELPSPIEWSWPEAVGARVETLLPLGRLLVTLVTAAAQPAVRGMLVRQD